MKCELCKEREAAVIIQETHSKGMREQHICLECARSKGLAAINPQAAQVLSSIMNSTDPAIQNAQSQTTRASVRHSILDSCPACSTKYLDIKRTGISGCPVCWNTWGPLLYSKGRKKGYRGKYPQSRLGDTQSIPQQQLFEEELKKAIATEDYEKAAYYRDRIQQLKLDRE